MTYRPGSHHGVTIVNEADTAPCDRPDHDCARGHLVAVIVNQDWDLAEHICDRLNAVTPDVTHTNGAREALAHVAVRIANAADDFDAGTLATLRIILESAAAELGVDEEAPPTPRAAKPWECKLAREHNPQTDPCDCRVSQFCAMGRSVDDAPGNPLSATQTAQTGPARGSGYTEAAETLSAASATVHLIRQDYGTTGCCHRVPSALPLTDRLTLHPDAATCGQHEPERKADQE